MGFDTGGGAAPTNAEYVTASSDPSLSNETVISPASDILVSGSLGQSSEANPGFGSFRRPSANYSTYLLVRVIVNADSGNAAEAKITVDETGDGTDDYVAGRVYKDKDMGSNSFILVAGQTSVLLPANAQYKIKNVSDPDGLNRVRDVRETVIAP